MTTPTPIPDRPLWSYVVVDSGLVTASVIIMDDLIAIGSLRWMALADPEKDDDAGMIGYVYVDPCRRHQGVATLIEQIAKDESQERGWTPPHHSDDRTEDGAAWTEHLGAPPALSEEEQAAKLDRQISGSD